MGDICIAKAEGPYENRLYKINAKILTGPLEGKDCIVAYKGEPEFFGRNILIRLDYVLENYRKDLESPVAGYFVSSEPDPEFEFAYSKDVIFYGIWHAINEVDKPSFRTICDRHFVGILLGTLHFQYRDSYVESYNLKKGQKVGANYRGGRPRSMDAAIRRYLQS